MSKSFNLDTSLPWGGDGTEGHTSRFFSAQHLKEWSIGIAVAAAATAAISAAPSTAFAQTQPASTTQQQITRQVAVDTNQTTATLITGAATTSTTSEPAQKQPASATPTKTTDTAAEEAASTEAPQAAKAQTTQEAEPAAKQAEPTVNPSPEQQTSSAAKSDTTAATPQAASVPSATTELKTTDATENKTPTNNKAYTQQATTAANKTVQRVAPRVRAVNQSGATVNGQYYSTIADAIAAAKVGDTVVVSGTLDDVAPITITKNLTMVAGQQGATINFANQHGILVTNGAKFVLGDTSKNVITLNVTKNQKLSSSTPLAETAYVVRVENGDVTVNKSAVLNMAEGDDFNYNGASGYTLSLSSDKATGNIYGGTFYAHNANANSISSNNALDIVDGAHIGTISGGTFESYQESLELSGNATIDEISGGTFKSLVHFGSYNAHHVDGGAGSRFNAYVENGAHIGTISGGTFEVAPDGNRTIYQNTDLIALEVSYNGSIDEISGGTFIVPGKYVYDYGVHIDANTDNPNTPKHTLGWPVQATDRQYGVTRAAIDVAEDFDENNSKVKAHIGKISGGTFEAPVALYLNNFYQHISSPLDTPVIDEISGGTFTSNALAHNNGAALWIDYGLGIGKISGGTFGAENQESWAYAVLNKGTIDEISGGSFNGTNSQSGFTNYAGHQMHLTDAPLPQDKDGKYIGGVVHTISGGTFTGSSAGSHGFFNMASIDYNNNKVRAVVDTISGGSFTGTNGVYNMGTLTNITGGTFTGNGGSAVFFYGSSTNIEPALDGGSVGKARFKGVAQPTEDYGSGVFNDAELATLPKGYAVSDATTSVDGANGYHYLTMKATVTYDANGGSLAADTAASDDAEFATDNKAKLNVRAADAVTRTNYRFVGWNTAADGSGTSYAVGTALNFTPQTRNLTLYAQWAYDYTVSFNKNADGATGTMPDVTEASEDTSSTLPANTFTHTGYIFTGWNTQADGNGTQFADGAALTSPLTSEAGGHVTLYAQWKPIHYIIAFNANGGSGAMNNVDATYDKDATLTPNAFTFANHKFAGWRDAQGHIYPNEAVVKNLTTKDGETIVLYAQWNVVINPAPVTPVQPVQPVQPESPKTPTEPTTPQNPTNDNPSPANETTPPTQPSTQVHATAAVAPQAPAQMETQENALPKTADESQGLLTILGGIAAAAAGFIGLGAARIRRQKKNQSK